MGEYVWMGDPVAPWNPSTQHLFRLFGSPFDMTTLYSKKIGYWELLLSSYFVYQDGAQCVDVYDSQWPASAEDARWEGEGIAGGQIDGYWAKVWGLTRVW